MDTRCFAESTVPCMFGLLEGLDNFHFPTDDGMAIVQLPALSVSFDAQFRLARTTFTNTNLPGGTLTVE